MFEVSLLVNNLVVRLVALEFLGEVAEVLVVLCWCVLNLGVVWSLVLDANEAFFLTFLINGHDCFQVDGARKGEVGLGIQEENVYFSLNSCVGTELFLGFRAV